MLEAQRIRLLGNMGLKPMLPRFCLEAAKPSSLLDGVSDIQVIPASDSGNAVAKNESAGTVPLSVSEVPQSPLSLVEQAQNIIQKTHVDSLNVSLKETNISAIVPSSELDSDIQVKTAALRFRQRIVCCGDMLMLLDQPMLNWQDEAIAKLFFEDVFFSLNAQLPEMVTMDCFEWPPAKKYPDANNLDIARATYVGFLHSKIEKMQCHSLVCWGEKSYQLLFDLSDETHMTQRLHNIPVLKALEIERYWQEPLLKRQLSLDLQKFKTVCLIQ